MKLFLTPSQTNTPTVIQQSDFVFSFVQPGFVDPRNSFQPGDILDFLVSVSVPITEADISGMTVVLFQEVNFHDTESLQTLKITTGAICSQGENLCIEFDSDFLDNLPSGVETTLEFEVVVEIEFTGDYSFSTKFTFFLFSFIFGRFLILAQVFLGKEVLCQREL